MTTTNPTSSSNPLGGYTYTEKLIAPNVVEFFARTSQGHRIVRVYLDYGPQNPRLIAFNESVDFRSPAILFMEEINDLVDRAISLIDSTHGHSHKPSNQNV